jgi:hypothetical protein
MFGDSFLTKCELTFFNLDLSISIVGWYRNFDGRCGSTPPIAKEEAR